MHVLLGQGKLPNLFFTKVMAPLGLMKKCYVSGWDLSAVKNYYPDLCIVNERWKESRKVGEIVQKDGCAISYSNKWL